MIFEIADIHVQPGRASEFEQALNQGLHEVFPQARGFLGHEVQRCIETPERYVLLLRWETVEDHTVGFRGSPLFAQWRGLVGDFFAQPPKVEHFSCIDRSTRHPGVNDE